MLTATSRGFCRDTETPAKPPWPVGGVLEVMSSDEGTKEDIPLWAKKVGHDFLGNVEEAGYWRLFVKRGK